jgi:hypothetical protein
MSLTLEPKGRIILLVEPPDLPIVAIAIKLLTKALKRAEDAVSAVRVKSPGLDQRKTDLEALSELQSEGGDRLRVPAGLGKTLRVALSLEWDAVDDLMKKKAKLEIEVDEESDRKKVLDRLLSAPDVAGMGEPIGTGTNG